MMAAMAGGEAVELGEIAVAELAIKTWDLEGERAERGTDRTPGKAFHIGTDRRRGGVAAAPVPVRDDADLGPHGAGQTTGRVITSSQSNGFAS